MDDIIGEFIAETQEGLTELDTALINLESNPEDRPLLDKIFRTLHTIKGTCGFLGLMRLEKVAHIAETLLDGFRQGERVATPADIALILKAFDHIRELMEALEATGQEPQGDDSALIGAIQAAIDGVAASDAAPEKTEAQTDVPAAEMPPEWGEVADDPFADIFAQTEVLPENIVADEASPVEADPVETGQVETDQVETGPVEASPAANSSAAKPPVADNKPALKPAAGKPAKEDAHGAAETANQFLRVSVGTLEKMLTLVSELVLARNQIVQDDRARKTTGSAPVQRLSTIVSDLQDCVMQARMQPIGNAWTKFPRIIHDIAREQQKKIHLEMIGEEVEIDRQVLELIKDPLMHMVRNSADHGIELPQERLLAGKPETGTVTLSAAHESGYIVITIADDGKGISPARIRAKALEKGLATAEYLDAMADRQVLSFIFAPGFSTAEKVTAISGRGVGMDVVRTNIQRIGGTVDLDSIEGRGSTFKIRIPLTLAIISALIVEQDEQRYAVPQIAVQELIRISADTQEQIEQIAGQEVLRLRGQLLPLVDLCGLLNKTPCDLSQSSPKRNVVVINAGDTRYGIVVKHVLGTEEIVVKPMASILRHISIFSGNTILGDGQVIMILDPSGVAGAAHIANAQRAHENDAISRAVKENLSSMLLFSAENDTPKAVPAFLISRIENFERAKIEYVAGKPVIQYGGHLIALHSLGEVPDRDVIKTLIFSNDSSGVTFGVMTENVRDIVSVDLQIDHNGARPGFIGSAIIAGQATEIVDINYFAGEEGWKVAEPTDDILYSRDYRPRILLVDDSAFFRYMLQPFLNMAGYDVTVTSGPKGALALCDNGYDFDMIISDIEMEEMDGLTFAETVKNQTRWRNIPMVALSSRATPQDREKGFSKGFSAYVAKSDRGALLSTLKSVFDDAMNKGA